jgi:hypothetical protein
MVYRGANHSKLLNKFGRAEEKWDLKAVSPGPFRNEIQTVK